MPILSYQQIVNSLTPDALRKESSEVVAQLMSLFAKEKYAFDHNRLKQKMEPTVIENLAMFAMLPNFVSAEYMLLNLTDPEKRALQLLGDIFGHGLAQLEKYPKVRGLFAVGTTVYPQEHRQILQDAIDSCDGDVQTTEKEVVEEYNSQYQHIAKETIQATIDKKGNDIDLIVTGSTYTLTPQQKAEARQHYLKRAIPKLLKDNNISYEYEKGPRLNGSSYGVWPEHKVIMHTKDIDPSRNKQDALILYFPDCRPIHLDVSIDKYTERYEIEKKHPRPFAVLFQSLCEDLHFKKLIDDALAGTLVIPETLSLSEKMKAVVAQKKYISRSEVNKNIVEERQKREKEKTEIPF